jgi:hypothetical protein
VGISLFEKEKKKVTPYSHFLSDQPLAATSLPLFPSPFHG